MAWVDRFRWTSRTELCAQLLQFLFTTPPTPPRDPERWTPDQRNRIEVASLFHHLRDASSAAGLMRLLVNRSEERWVRIQALYGLRDLAETPRLSVSEMDTLLRDRLLWDDSPEHPSYRGDCFVFIVLLSLIRGEEAARLAQSFLSEWPARARSELLRDLPGYIGEPDPTLVDWLYQQWLCDDRLAIGEVKEDERDPWPLNLHVALAHPDRPESRLLLRAFWLRASREDRPALLDELWYSLGEEIGCLATETHERQEFAEALALPLSDLLQLLSPESLLDRIEISLRDASRAIAASRWPHPPGWREEPGRALAFLARWPDASVNNRIASLCCCPDLHVVLRRELLEILWKREPTLALVILGGAIGEKPPANEAPGLEIPVCTNETRLRGLGRQPSPASEGEPAHGIGEPALLPLARWLLPWMCQRPRPEDGEFYRWILEQEAHPVIRYHAVEALERLGEHGTAWRERLAGMARSRDPYLRVHALGALVRRGETALLERLEQIARRARHVCMRAEAIRVLGELDAARYLPLLRRALLEDHATCGLCPSDLPAAEEAAIALSRLGTPEALSAVVHGYLTVPCQDLQSWIGEWLRLSDEPQQGSPILHRNGCWGVCRLDTVDRGHYRRWLDEEEE